MRRAQVACVMRLRARAGARLCCTPALGHAPAGGVLRGGPLGESPRGVQYRIACVELGSGVNLARVCMCMCVCVCVFFFYLFVNADMHTCMYARVSEHTYTEREQQEDGERERGSETETEREKGPGRDGED